jgi:23S rRNA pseudouridine1911/1915/1917 synthase
MPPSSIPNCQLTIPATVLQIRLDRWLHKQFPENSRTEIQNWIRAGYVQSPSGPLRPGADAVPGMQLNIQIPPAISSEYPQPEKIPLDILYEDADLVALNKFPGQVVHPAPGHPGGTVLNGILERYPDIAAVGDPQRPGLVHRLDSGTSGVLLFARNNKSLTALQAAFKSRKVTKIYHCICHGIPEPYAQSCNQPIGRHPVHRKKRAVDGLAARSACSHFRLIRGLAGGTGGLLEVTIETGRTHQIRVHLAHAGHPVIGDTVYAGKKAQLPNPWPKAARVMLHARHIAFTHPISGKPLEINADYPEDFVQFLHLL